MKITIATQAAAFKPVTVTIICHTQTELDTLHNIAKLNATIPNVVDVCNKDAAYKLLGQLCTSIRSLGE